MPYGRILIGTENAVQQSYSNWNAQPVDQEMLGEAFDENDEFETTLRGAVSVSGPGTFFGRAQRTLTFEPTDRTGWWFDRTDIPGSMPIRVSANNVWTTVRNIVLSSGSPHNYMRMVEHIVALKAGLNLDNVLIKMDSGDPPLFERGSMDIVEAVEEVGIVAQDRPSTYLTVKEPVTVAGHNNSFLTFLPSEDNSHALVIDCAVDFKTAIGKQRIRFSVNRKNFRHAAVARTNTTFWKMIFTKTIGKIFADIRNLGYTTSNILVAGPRRYYNKPHLIHDGKSLEAVWHRACLDLLAAVALIDSGRFAGSIISYKAGHALDVEMIQKLYEHNLFVEI